MPFVENVAPAVQAQLPELENIRKTIQQEKSSNLPKNPTNIEELHHLPNELKKTLVGENFLLYDIRSKMQRTF